MKKTLKTVLVAAGLFAGTILSAQNVQDGVAHLYAERLASAKATFEKMLASNPNNIEATYWLGQTHLANDDIASARGVYEKALMTNGNAPLLLVGMGHVELLENKPTEARQRFETAISISRTKKGDDPVVLNAIGKANVHAADNKFKTGDLNYAVEKLTLAAQRDPKNADIFVNLGNAYRKLHNGGQAVTNYNNALTISPSLAYAAYRNAKIYETQKNWEPYVYQLEKAITADPKFAPAYYELYYYHLGKLEFDKANDFGAKYIANSDPDPQNDYIRIQTLFAQKKYDEAIAGAKNLITQAGEKTKPRVYKLIAYSNVYKGDTLAAKEFVDQYFAKATEEDIVGQDHILKGLVYGAAANDDQVVLQSYITAAAMDSVYASKMQTLQQGVDYFKNRNKKVKEAEMRQVVFANRKTPNPAEHFFIGLAFYQGGDFNRADSSFKLYTGAFPDSLFGHYWLARTNFALDTTMSVEPYASTMVNGYQRTLEIALANPRFKSQGIAASKFLAGYYNNVKGSKDSAIAYLQKGLQLDPNDASVQELIDILQKPSRSPAGQRPGTKATGGPSPGGATKPAEAKAGATKK